MIFIQSKGQLVSKRDQFNDQIAFTRNKELLIFSDVFWITKTKLILNIFFNYKPIIMGDVRSTYSLIRRLIHPKRTRFLSDGLGTEVAKKSFINNKSLYFYKKGLPLHIRIMDFITKWNPVFIDTIIRQKELNDNGKVIFIGQALSENKIVSEVDEIDAISKSDARYYIAHPKDSKSKLDKIKDLGHIQLICTQLPAEEYLESIGFNKLIGFSSTVLFNFRNYNIELIDIKYKSNYSGTDCYEGYKILKEYV